MFEGYIAGKLANRMYEHDVFKIVKKHAFWGALIMILPLFGLDWLIYCYILWHMYYAICQKVGVSLNFGNVIVGFIVNIIVAIVLDAILTFIPFLIGFIVYAQFYFSGKAYIETLKKMKN